MTDGAEAGPAGQHVSPVVPRRTPSTCFRSALISSPIPPRCRRASVDKEGVILGIDEAGRGPVLGPMVYSAVYWSRVDDEAVSAMGFDDSKALTAEQRANLFRKVHEGKAMGVIAHVMLLHVIDFSKNPQVGWVLRLLSARELSEKMCRKVPFSLNVISHDAAAEMIKALQVRGVRVAEVYADTVGDPAYYRARLEKEFGSEVKFVVEKKADSLYKTVSAASIIAKVTRDRILEGWQWTEPNLDFQEDRNFGSGYPGDERCKAWLEANLDPVFGFPDVCRFSWGTSKELLRTSGKRVDWEEEADEAAAGMDPITNFMVRPKKKLRTNLFAGCGLDMVDAFPV